MRKGVEILRTEDGWKYQTDCERDLALRTYRDYGDYQGKRHGPEQHLEVTRDHGRSQRGGRGRGRRICC